MDSAAETETSCVGAFEYRRRGPSGGSACSLLLATATLLLAFLYEGSRAVAQEAVGETGVASVPDTGEEAVEEGPDPTRLDVERLPPEAIDITRDLYASGIIFEGWVGARGFLGDLGAVADPGLLGTVGVGFEWFHWLSVLVALEASFHNASGPAPPNKAAFELLGGIAALRAQLNLDASFALFAQGEIGVLLALGDVLRVFGFDQSDTVNLQFGGSGGVDWHFANRHMSIGLLAGARLYPGLASTQESVGFGVHGSVYLRYVL